MKAQIIPLCTCISIFKKIEIGELTVNNNVALFIPYYCNTCNVIESIKYTYKNPTCNTCDNKMNRYGLIERTTGDEIYNYGDDFMERFVLYCYTEPNMIYSLSNENHFCPKCKKMELTFLT